LVGFYCRFWSQRREAGADVGSALALCVTKGWASFAKQDRAYSQALQANAFRLTAYDVRLERETRASALQLPFVEFSRSSHIQEKMMAENVRIAVNAGIDAIS
jgi:hypothetical protein